MLDVSDRFLAALRDTHAVSVAAFLYAPGSSDPVEVNVIGGTVDANSAARILRQASVDLALAREDTDLRDLIEALPFGGYCSVERGIRFADRTVERVPLGMFRVDSVVCGELTGTATLSLSDRFAQVRDEPFPAPWTPVGMHPSDALVNIVQQVFGSSIAYHVETVPSSEPVMAGTIYDSDKTAAITDLTQAIGGEVLFDAYGDFVVRPSYKPGNPAWTINAGRRGVLTKAETTLDRSSVRNGVSVRGQPDSDQPPIYGLALYTNPTDPLRWGGPFGKVLLIADSTAVTTQAQADAAAASLLNLRLALSRTFNVESVPNPALEPEDVVAIVFPDGSVEQQAIKETHIGLDSSGTLQLVTVDKYNADFSPDSDTVQVLHGTEAQTEMVAALVGD